MKKIILSIFVLMILVSNVNAQSNFTDQKLVNDTAKSYYKVVSLGLGTKSVLFKNKSSNICYVGFAKKSGQRDSTNVYEVPAGEMVQFINRSSSELIYKGNGVIQIIISNGDGSSFDSWGNKIDTTLYATWDSLAGVVEHANDTATGSHEASIAWIDGRHYAKKDTAQVITGLWVFWNIKTFGSGLTTDTIYSSTNDGLTFVNGSATILDIKSSSVTNYKNGIVNGHFTVDTIKNTGDMNMISTTGIYWIASPNGTANWKLQATNASTFHILITSSGNGLNITSSNAIYPTLADDGDLGLSANRFRNLLITRAVDILGTNNKIKTYYDVSNGLEISANSLGNGLYNITGAQHIFGNTAAAQWMVITSGSIRGGSNRGQDLGTTGVRINNSYFGNNLDITWASNIDAGFLRGTTDTDMTGIYLRSPNGTKYYITVDDAGIISSSVSTF